jgi:hypothetical protein
MDASRLARALWGGGYAPENDAIAYGRNVDRQAARSELLDALAGTWPAQMAKSAVGAAALPGDVYAGRVDPMSQQGIERAADLTGLMTLGSFGVQRPHGSLGMGGKPAPRWLPEYQRQAWDMIPDNADKVKQQLEAALGVPVNLSKSDSNYGRSWYLRPEIESKTESPFVVRVSDHGASPRAHQVEAQIYMTSGGPDETGNWVNRTANPEEIEKSIQDALSIARAYALRNGLKLPE